MESVRMQQSILLPDSVGKRGAKNRCTGALAGPQASGHGELILDYPG